MERGGMHSYISIDSPDEFKRFFDQEILSLSDHNLTSLKGIEVLTNLREFYFDLNDITDISSLSQLTNLERINIYRRGVHQLTDKRYFNSVDISVKIFRKMKKLKRLHFYPRGMLIYKDLFYLNLYHIDLSSNNIISKFSNYKNRLKIAQKIILSLIIKNRIKYYWDRFLEAKNKDSISRYCFLANDVY